MKRSARMWHDCQRFTDSGTWPLAAKPADPCVRGRCAAIQKQKETHSWWKTTMTMTIKIVLNLRHKIYILGFVMKLCDMCQSISICVPTASTQIKCFIIYAGKPFSSEMQNNFIVKANHYFLVRLTSPTYYVNENDSFVEVCAKLTSQSNPGLSVVLSTTDGKKAKFHFN